MAKHKVIALNKKILAFVFVSIFITRLTPLLYSEKEKNKEEFTLIRSAIFDLDNEVKVRALDAVVALDDKQSISAVKSLLNEGSDLLKIKAAFALAKLGDNSAIPVLRRILANAPKLSENPKPIERVKVIAKNSARVEAAKAIGELKDQGSFDVLKDNLHDADGRVTDACLIAMGKMGVKKAQDDFVSALESTKQEVRAKAIESLGDMGVSDAIPGLRKRMDDWSKEAKTAAFIALAKLKDTESLPQIKKYLKDPDEIIRQRAVEAVAIYQDRSAIADLDTLLKDENGFVRIAAAKALAGMGNFAGREFLIKTISESTDADARLKALSALKGMVTKKEISVLKPLMSDNDKRIAILAAELTIIAGNTTK